MKRIDKLAWNAAVKYVEEWVNQQTIFVNATTKRMNTDYYAGYKAGYDQAKADAWAAWNQVTAESPKFEFLLNNLGENEEK